MNSVQPIAKANFTLGFVVFLADNTAAIRATAANT